DQQIAMHEFASQWTEQKLREFQSYDINGDGLLTSNEILQSKALVGGSYSNDDAEILPPRKTIISEIVVDEDYPIGDLNVQLSITHTYVSQLDGYLTGPDGQRIELFTEVGGSDDHFDQTIFDDQSRAPITKARPPFKGAFMPEALVKRQPSLSSFNGKSVKGVWQLVVRCSRSERFGMLHGWKLIVTPQGDLMDPAASQTPAPQTPAATNTTTNTLDAEKTQDSKEQAAPSASNEPQRAIQLQQIRQANVESAGQRLRINSGTVPQKLEARVKVFGKYKPELKGKNREEIKAYYQKLSAGKR
ncbi:MAG: proprotein convertase P-domain-containing protein, partial [Pirellulales bacterium]|nr:proprotein convertase P-domain-containing protein [Pirellulales bacterium]